MEGSVILITGASSGIGQHLSRHFSLINDSNFVIGCGRSSKIYTYFDYVECDITKEKDLDELFMHIKNIYGRLDILINNAGTSSMNAFMLTPFSTMYNIINLNLLSLANVTQRAARLMIPNKYGRIINITSVAEPLELEGESIYAASKAGVNSLTRVLSKELASYNITVNAVGPTPIETNLLAGVSKDKINSLLNRQAIKRMAQFEDVANAVDFFINPRSEMITGQIVYLGGV
jgi:3-oxoacyl-[acyl-carrier protein] reductase